jgi:hypothetical protein
VVIIEVLINIEGVRAISNLLPQILTELKNANVVEHAMGESNIHDKNFAGYVYNFARYA